MSDKYTKPDISSSVLITIDTQCDTLDGQPLEIPGTTKALPVMKAILDEFRALNYPIIHIVRIYKRDGSNVDLCRRAAVESGAPMLLEGTTGCELARDLFDKRIELDTELLLSGDVQEISKREVIIYKPRWGAFYKTPLDAYLSKLGVTTLIFTGCNYPNCPRTSIYEASERDYRIVLITDAISGLYEKGKNEMRNIGVNMLSSKSLIGELRKVSGCTKPAFRRA
jgi:nicotinamidase-related amidase